MTIATSIAANVRKPGVFHEFDFLSSVHGIAPTARRVALMGCRTSAGAVAAGVPTQIFDAAASATAFGVGSELDIMCKAALEAAKSYKSSPQIWACAIDENGAGVKATFTITLTGNATAAGDLVESISGREVTAGIASGDTPTQAAAKYVLAVNARAKELFVTATSALGVVTLTANNKGVNGNDVKVANVRAPAGVTAVVAAAVAGTGAADIQGALDALVDKRYKTSAIANHTSTDLTKLATWFDLVGGFSAKKWATAWMAETSSLSAATTLATTANRPQQFVATAEGFPGLPGELAAMIATMIAAEERPNRSFDGVPVPTTAPAAAYTYTDPEIEAALYAGATPLVADERGHVTIVRAVSTKTTEASVPFENLLDAGNILTMFDTAEQCDIACVLAFQREDASKPTLKRVRGVVYAKMKDLEEAKWIQNVDKHMAELRVEPHPSVPTRIQVFNPVSVVPNLHQISFLHGLYVENAA